MATTWHEPQRIPSATERASFRLLELTAQREHYERELFVRVREAREAGLSWAAIGSALGMTKQGAHFRFSGVEGP